MLNKTSKTLAEVFKDVGSHQKINGIIKNHLTNQSDIREIALGGIDFLNAIKILDLGCGFGFFTQALRGKTNPQAKITGIDCHTQYRESYLDSCKYAGIEGRFIGECINSIRRIKSNSIDLILCSFALYFFPEIISQISRILKDDGVFVTITHGGPHMHQIGSHVKKAISANDLDYSDDLPFEILMNIFSGENGEGLLAPWFGNVRAKDYKNSLIFREAGFTDLEAYLRFKQSFFIPAGQPETEKLIAMVLDLFKQDIIKNGIVEISKDDKIFTCTNPLMKGNAR
ncbi:MAG: hypothetical protein B6D64_01205 [Bacteroidetes bacterium 4484_276]|nr:MAG: hypothetical protein B6D64_01205 [Bacteroidetes bacterium 4484_276]OYT13266.1 MAG: hypothetical protein B6I19_06010 [Bacteroidetes bacterium 4572_114]